MILSDGYAAGYLTFVLLTWSINCINLVNYENIILQTYK